MTDVLAKPFIREGMQRMLRKHLPHLLAEPPSQTSTTDGAYGGGPGGGVQGPVEMGSDPSSLASAHHMAAMKFEGTPIQSPSGGQAGAGAWGSPGGGMGTGGHSSSSSTSPMGMGLPVNGGQLVMGQALGYEGFAMVDERPGKRRMLSQGVMR